MEEMACSKAPANKSSPRSPDLSYLWTWPCLGFLWPWHHNLLIDHLLIGVSSLTHLSRNHLPLPSKSYQPPPKYPSDPITSPHSPHHRQGLHLPPTGLPAPVSSPQLPEADPIKSLSCWNYPMNSYFLEVRFEILSLTHEAHGGFYFFQFLKLTISFLTQSPCTCSTHFWCHSSLPLFPLHLST